MTPQPILFAQLPKPSAGRLLRFEAMEDLQEEKPSPTARQMLQDASDQDKLAKNTSLGDGDGITYVSLA
jgi:hypothetical protein